MKNELLEVMELQHKYSSKNTTEMQRRGLLIRKLIPKELSIIAEQLKSALGPHGNDLGIEGRDGTDQKTLVPWVRFYSDARSPNPRDGWYCVYLFEALGEGVYLELGHGSTRLEGGQYVARDPDELAKYVSWGREVLKSVIQSAPDLQQPMVLHGQDLADAYERSAVLAKWYSAKDIPNNEILYKDAVEFAGYLKTIYDAETSHVQTSVVEKIAGIDAGPGALRMAPTNLIFYGPPGTGKTYSTIAEAVRLCDGAVPEEGAAAVKVRFDTLTKARRIEFITFHQSYSYEDFVMGLRPDTADGASGGFSLVPTPGVFYRISKAAGANRGPVAESDKPKLNKGLPVFKMSLGDTSTDEGTILFRECVDGDYVLLGWGGDIDWSSPEYDELQAITDRWRKEDRNASAQDANIRQLHRFRNLLKENDLVIISLGNKKFRAVGRITGPYQYVPRVDEGYRHRRSVRWLWHDSNGLPREQIYSKGFIQVSIYQLDGNDLEWPALEQIISGGGAISKQVGLPEPYVLIIDEINRADVSKVLGELITLLEPDKRLGMVNALTVTLPYSNEQFGVPANLHVIGTMNTADRSIALLDTALRRRFHFRELMPDPSKLDPVEGIDIAAALNGLNNRIEFLFDRDHQIGHAYFMGCKSRDELEDVMRHKVVPLLVEYFYEDWAKIWRVLGEPEEGEGAFLHRQKLAIPKWEEEADLDTERWRYTVRNKFAAHAFAQLAK